MRPNGGVLSPKGLNSAEVGQGAARGSALPMMVLFLLVLAKYRVAFTSASAQKRMQFQQMPQGKKCDAHQQYGGLPTYCRKWHRAINC